MMVRNLVPAYITQKLKTPSCQRMLMYASRQLFKGATMPSHVPGMLKTGTSKRPTSIGRLAMLVMAADKAQPER